MDGFSRSDAKGSAKTVAMDTWEVLLAQQDGEEPDRMTTAWEQHGESEQPATLP